MPISVTLSPPGEPHRPERQLDTDEKEDGIEQREARRGGHGEK
jgi:hypothetical protein